MSTPLSVATIRAEALRRGFAACGVATLEPNAHSAFLDAWLAAGYAGTMRYLHRQATKRKDPSLATPGARSAIVLLENYAAPPEERPQPGDAFKIASYARGTDYHITTQDRLQELATWLLEHGASIAHPRVDAGPVPERELAHRAGLGWIGKNTMLIHPAMGSFTFIGTILTDLALSSDTPEVTDHCGTCTRCLDACPTEAFVAPGILDATRCISYLTIECKDDPAPDLAAQFQGWAFGCDICNDVCPWNVKFATATTLPAFARRPLDARDPHLFETMSEAAFQEAFADSPLSRPGLTRMQRNARLALASRTPEGTTTP